MPTKTEYYYIRFMKSPMSMGRKTEIWNCQNVTHGSYLGEVLWSGAWRQYVFAPMAHTEFSAGCLIDIAGFVGQLMAERK